MHTDHTFTVTVPDSFAGTVSLGDGLIGDQAGVFTPKSLSFAAGDDPKTFTYRAPKYGTRSFSLKNDADLPTPPAFDFKAKIKPGLTGPMDGRRSDFKAEDYLTPDFGGYEFFKKAGALASLVARIDSDPVSIYSGQMLACYDTGGAVPETKLYPGSFDMHENAGFPLAVVNQDQPKVPIRLGVGDDADLEHSDPGPYPFPDNARVQGHQYPSPVTSFNSTDSHVLVFDRDEELVYETYHTYKDPIQGWTAANGWIVDLANSGWGYRKSGEILYVGLGEHRFPAPIVTASGLPILPLSIRYDEVYIQKEIRHAIGMTLPNVKLAGTWVWPARGIAYMNRKHWNDTWGMTIPYGARLRLKSSWYTANVVNAPASSWGPGAAVVLKALKEYGSIITDGGLNFDMWVIADSRWSTGTHRTPNYTNDLQRLGTVPASAFEVVAFEDDLLEITVMPDVAPVGTPRTILIKYNGWSRHTEENKGNPLSDKFIFGIMPRDVATDGKRFSPDEKSITPVSPIAEFNYTPTSPNEEWYPLTLPLGLPWPYAKGPWIIKTN